MVLAIIGLIMEAIATLIIAFKTILFFFFTDRSVEALNKFIVDILTFGVNESIPLEVTIIQIFGVFGIIFIVADAILSGGK